MQTISGFDLKRTKAENLCPIHRWW